MEVGLVDYVANRVVDGPPVAHIKILRSAGRWTAESWDELFALDRTGLEANARINRARCWALVFVRTPGSFSAAVKSAAQGKPVAPPRLNVAKFEDALEATLAKVELPCDDQ